jgi:hypothetical protein
MNSGFQNSSPVPADIKAQIAAQISELMQLAVMLQATSLESTAASQKIACGDQRAPANNGGEVNRPRAIDTLVTQLTRLSAALPLATDTAVQTAPPQCPIDTRPLYRLVELMLRIVYGREPRPDEVNSIIEAFDSQNGSLNAVISLIAKPIDQALQNSRPISPASPALMPSIVSSEFHRPHALERFVADVLTFATGEPTTRSLVSHYATEIAQNRLSASTFMSNEFTKDKALAHLAHLGVVFGALNVKPLRPNGERLHPFLTFDHASIGFVSAEQSALSTSTRVTSAPHAPTKPVPLTRAPGLHVSVEPTLVSHSGLLPSKMQRHLETPKFFVNGLDAIRRMGDKAVVTALGVADRTSHVVSNGVTRVAESTYVPLKQLADDVRERIASAASTAFEPSVTSVPPQRVIVDKHPAQGGQGAGDAGAQLLSGLLSQAQPPSAAMMSGVQHYSPLVLLPLECNEATLGVPLRDKKNSDEQLLAEATSQIQKLQDLLVGRLLFDLPRIEPEKENQVFSDFLLKNGIEYPIKHVRVLNALDDVGGGSFQSNRLTMVVDGGARVASASFL